MAKTLRHHLLNHIHKTAQHHVGHGNDCADLAEHFAETHPDAAAVLKTMAKRHADYAEHCVALHDEIDKASDDDLGKVIEDNVRGVIPDNPTRQTDDNKLVFRTTAQDQGADLADVPDALKKLVARD